MTNNDTEITEPRYPSVSRRAFLRGSAGVGIAALAAQALTACGSTSTSSPETSPQSTVGSTSPETTVTTNTTAATDTAAATTATDALPVATEAAAAAAFADGRQFQVDFTYAAGGGGRVHSPYIAVWIEDPDGNLVQTVSLWYKSDERKYLKDLKRWNSKNNSDAVTTGATRIPGSFSVAWDGADLGGEVVADGDYFVCVEAAREDGPYQIVREAVSITGALAPTALTPNGELTACSVALVA